MGLYKYHGCFIDKKYLDEVVNKNNALAKDIKYPHVTFKFAPKDFEVDESLFGAEVKIVAVGYGNNGENEGLLVKLYSDIPELQKKFDKIEVPHITLSISETGKAFNTSKLEFYEISPIELIGTYGAYTQEMSLDDPPILEYEDPDLDLNL